MVNKVLDKTIGGVKNKFEIEQVYNHLFGYRGMPFPYGENSLENDIIESRVDSFKSLKNIFKKSKIGVDFFMPMKFYYEEDNDPILKIYQLPNEPTFSLGVQKNIVQTAIAGNNIEGTVKELISTSDWNIEIKGVVINENENTYPFKDIEEINKICLLDKPIIVENELMMSLGIENIVIKKLEFVEMVGVQNAQGYKISAVSDGDIELELVDDKKNKK